VKIFCFSVGFRHWVCIHPGSAIMITRLQVETTVLKEDENEARNIVYNVGGGSYCSFAKCNACLYQGAT
jgi:hypothetical protein